LIFGSQFVLCVIHHFDLVSLDLSILPQFDFL
jgi:hypothetical protein